MFENYNIDKNIAEIHFACHLTKCKGGCCTVYGGSGAPLLAEELELIEKNLESAKKYLSERNINYIEKKGFWEVDLEGSLTTLCINSRDCVFVYYEGDIAKCAIERAYFEGESDFRKPISCHLFPIRIRGNNLVYEEFSICRPALEKGSEENIIMGNFLKDAIIRRFSEDFYNNLQNLINAVQTKGIKKEEE
jgi:hypothetical protein